MLGSLGRSHKHNWSPPPSGVVKLTCDIVRNDHFFPTAIIVIVVDSEGSVVHGIIKRFVAPLFL